MAPRNPRWPTLFLALASLPMLGFGASGCLTSKVGYDHTAWAVRMAVDDYVELSKTQEAELKAVLVGLHRWHRQEELPRYAVLANEAAGRVEKGLTLGDVEWAENQIRSRYRALMAEVAVRLAPIAGTVTPGQLSPMDARIARGNTKFRQERLSGPVEVRRDRQVRATLRQIERWVGSLEPAQRQIVTARLAKRPETSEQFYAQRLARQRAIRSLLSDHPTRDELVRGLQTWLVGWDAGRTADHEALHAETMRQTRLMVVELNQVLTVEQRARLIQRLHEHAADFSAWSTKEPK